MGGQRRKNWVGDDSAEAQVTFREMLLRLKAEGASNEEIAKSIIQSPFILGLIWTVTSKNAVAYKGRKTPDDWWQWLARDPELRTAWRYETLCRLGKARKNRGIPEKCDLERPSIGGYWRMIVIYTAIGAAQEIWDKDRIRVKDARNPGKDLVVHLGDKIDTLYKDGKGACHLGVRDGTSDGVGSWQTARDMNDQDELSDRRLELAMAIDGLEDPRQRKVMMLACRGYRYQEIADIMTKEVNTPSSASARKREMTYEMVRFAHQKALKILQKRMRGAA